MTTTPTLPGEARASVAAKQAAFSDSRMEPEDAAVRQQLGLRPSVYASDGIDTHPDRRPCPSWCWVGQSGGEYDHEVDCSHPMTAAHRHDGIPHVVASLYQGDNNSSKYEEDRFIQAATIEPHLEQLGQGAPIIRVALRHSEDGVSKYGEILKLTLTDAQELAAALTYLVDTADGSARA